MRQMFTLLIIFVLVFSSVDAFSQLSRKNQFEIYAGAGFPLSPDEFKDFYKVGLSLNVQYVFFPSYRLGIPIFAGFESFTVDNQALTDYYGSAYTEFNNYLFRSDIIGVPLYDNLGNYLGTITDGNLQSEINFEGTQNAFKFGIGIRPYLTPPEASTQLFLFGNATYNILKSKTKYKESINGASVTVEDVSGNLYTYTFTEQDLIDVGWETQTSSEEKDDENRMGIGFGAGIEVPVGEKLNLIFQGMYNLIFTKKIKDEFTGEEYGGTTSFIGATAGVVF